MDRLRSSLVVGFPAMNVSEIQTSALNLPERERAELAAQLLGSLPAVLADSDDGSAEASRRISEMKSDPSARRNWAQIKAEIGR
jgi:putative addiction module component (TIGR02574 family)